MGAWFALRTVGILPMSALPKINKYISPKKEVVKHFWAIFDKSRKKRWIIGNLSEKGQSSVMPRTRRTRGQWSNNDTQSKAPKCFKSYARHLVSCRFKYRTDANNIKNNKIIIHSNYTPQVTTKFMPKCAFFWRKTWLIDTTQTRAIKIWPS